MVILVASFLLLTVVLKSFLGVSEIELKGAFIKKKTKLKYLLLPVVLWINPKGSWPTFPFPRRSLHPADGWKRLARPQRRPGLQKGGLQGVRLQRPGLCWRALVPVQRSASFPLCFTAWSFILERPAEGWMVFNVCFFGSAGAFRSWFWRTSSMGWEKCIEGWLLVPRLNSYRSTSQKCPGVTCWGRASDSRLDKWCHLADFCDPFMVFVSSAGVPQESELRPSTETETWWTTLCLTAASGRWAVACSTCVTRPRRRRPPPWPLAKWSRTRWRVASLCRGRQEPKPSSPVTRHHCLEPSLPQHRCHVEDTLFKVKP